MQLYDISIYFNYQVSELSDKVGNFVDKVKKNPIVNRLNYKEVINSVAVRAPIVGLVNANTSLDNILFSMLREMEVRGPSTLIYASVTELFKKWESKWSYVAASVSVGMLSMPIEYCAHSYLHGQTRNLTETVLVSMAVSMITTPLHLYLYKNNIFNMTNSRTGYFEDYKKLFKFCKSKLVK